MNGPLRALSTGEDGGNGVFINSPVSAFPSTASGISTNFWVDVVFTTSVDADITPPTVTSVTPVNNATGVSVGTKASAIFNEAMNASTINSTTIELRNASNMLITTAVSYNAGTKTATLTPSAALAYSTVYTATIKGGASGVKDVSNNALTSNYTWSFTTADAAPVTYNIFPSTSGSSAGVGGAIEVGVKFRVTQPGYIMGIRFYKRAANTGTHIGHLWSSTGTKLAEATFTGETASGWQQVLFNTPVAVTAGTTYIASYFSSTGFSVTNSYFTQAVVNGPLRALANGEDGPNGVYKYSSVSAFPQTSGQSNNYWVDVVFTTSDVTAPTVTSVTPVNNATSVSVGTKASAIFNEAMNASTINSTTIELRNASNILITTAVSYNAGTKTATLTPSAALANSTVYTTKIKSGVNGVKDVSGNALASDHTWSFTTATATPVTYNIFPSTSFGTNQSAQPREVGVKFRVTQAGYITGIRFYKGAANTGTHIGNLWSSMGTKLAGSTFTGETASGWQQVLFSSPVAVTTGTTYIASYFTSTGNHAITTNYFTSAVVNGPLRALSTGEAGGNGVFINSPVSAFPSIASGISSNFWVDVVFTTSVVPDFTLTVLTPARNVATTGSADFKIDVAYKNGFASSNVNLSVSGLPANTTGNYLLNPMTHQGETQLIINTNNATPGTYNLTLTATAEGISHSQPATLTITTGADFALTASPSIQTVTKGNATTFTINVNEINDYVNPVTLSVTGLPAGTTASFNPAAPVPVATSIFTLTTSASTPDGTYNLTIQGTSGAVTRTTPIALTVTSAASVWTVSTMGSTGVQNNTVRVGTLKADGQERVYVGTIPTGRILEYAWDGSSWAGHVNIGGSLTGIEIHDMCIGPGRSDGKERLYGCSNDFKIYEFWHDETGWHQMTVGDLGSQATHAAVGVGRNDGITRLYGISAKQLFEFTWNGTSWTKLLLGNTPGAHGIVVGNGRNDGINNIYIASIGSGCFEARFNGTAWSITNMGTAGDARNLDLGMGRNDGVIRVYAAMFDGTVRELTWNGSTWTTVNMPSIGTQNIHAYVTTGRNDGVNRIYTSSGLGKVFEYTWTGSTWQTYNMGGGSEYMYGLHYGRGRNDGLIRLYGADRGSVNRVYEFTWTAPNPLVFIKKENEIGYSMKRRSIYPIVSLQLK